MTNKEYWSGLINKYEMMSDEEFARLIEEIDRDSAEIFLIKDNTVEYVFNDYIGKDDKPEYHAVLFDVQEDFSLDMSEEGAAA